MADLNVGAASTTNVQDYLEDFSPTSVFLDQAGDQKETYYDFPDTQKYLNYYKTIPELKKAIDALSLWVTGKGIRTTSINETILDTWSGNGTDNYLTIFKNLLIQKLAFGNAFAEIVWNDNKTKPANLKPLFTGDMRIIENRKGMLIRVEQRTGGKNQVIPLDNIFIIANDRIANEMHGTSVIQACQWVIDARNEILQDYRKVLHRNVVPVRIIEIDTDNTTKRDALIAQYQSAIQKGEVLVIPKGTVEIKDNSLKIQDPLAFIQYLENFFYTAVGIPRVIASSQEYSEASSKVGFLTFEPVYTSHQAELEQAIYKQLGIVLQFERPPSLSGMLASSEAKNTGQTGIQPSELNPESTNE